MVDSLGFFGRALSCRLRIRFMLRTPYQKTEEEKLLVFALGQLATGAKVKGR